MVVRELLTKIGFKTDTKSINKFEDNVKSAKASLIALTTAITATATAIVGLVESAAKAGDRLDKLRDIIGMTAREYQLLEGAASLAGIENEGFAKSMELFARTIGMARQGMSQYVRDFAILGINMRDANGQQKTQKELILEMADAFQNKLGKSVDRAAVARDLFGRAGFKMINFLKQGREGVLAASKEFETYGFILDDKAIKASQRFRDSQFLLKSTITGLKNEIGIALMPVVQKFINETLKWIKANRQLLKQSLVKFFKGMIIVTKAFGKALAFLIDGVKEAVTIWKHLNTAFGMTVKILTALIALKIASKILMLKRLITGGLGMVEFILSPIGLIALAIGSLLLILDDLAVYLSGGKSIIGLIFKKFPGLEKKVETTLKVVQKWLTITVIWPLKTIIGLIKEIFRMLNKLTSFVPKLGAAAVLGASKLGIAPANITSVVQAALNSSQPSASAVAGGGSRSFNVNTAINLTVPPGTPDLQKDFLVRAADKAFEPVFNRKLRDALSVFGATEQ